MSENQSTSSSTTTSSSSTTTSSSDPFSNEELYLAVDSSIMYGTDLDGPTRTRIVEHVHYKCQDDGCDFKSAINELSKSSHLKADKRRDIALLTAETLAKNHKDFVCTGMRGYLLDSGYGGRGSGIFLENDTESRGPHIGFISMELIKLKLAKIDREKRQKKQWLGSIDASSAIAGGAMVGGTTIAMGIIWKVAPRLLARMRK